MKCCQCTWLNEESMHGKHGDRVQGHGMVIILRVSLVFEVRVPERARAACRNKTWMEMKATEHEVRNWRFTSGSLGSCDKTWNHAYVIVVNIQTNSRQILTRVSISSPRT